MKSCPHCLVRSFMYPKAENIALASRLDTVVDDDDAVRHVEGLVLQRLEEMEERDRRALALAQVRDRRPPRVSA